MKREDKIRFPGRFYTTTQDKTAVTVADESLIMSLDLFVAALAEATDLLDVEITILKLLKLLKTRGFKIIYAAGNYPTPIPTDTKTLIFSAQNIFTAALLAKLGEINPQDLTAFWHSILKSGDVAGLYLYPGWVDSASAREQWEIDEENNMVIIYPELR